MHPAGWIIAMLLGACIRSHDVRCGDLLCPESSVCLPSGRCASEGAITACAGLAPNAACSTPLFDGTCIDGACTPTVCGDGLVAGNEQCDGSVQGVDCVTFGFDLGVPSCTERCDLDVITSCTRFGWRKIASVSPEDAWTDGDRLAVVRSVPNYGLDIYVGGQLTTSLDGYYARITGAAHSIVGWDDGSNHSVVISHGGAFEPVSPPSLSGTIGNLRVTDDDTLYLVANPGCAVYREVSGGTWTQIRQAGAGDCRALDVHDGQVLVGVNVTVERWAGQGTSWTPVFTTPAAINNLATLGTSIWAATTAGVVEDNAGSTRTFGSDVVFDVIPIESLLYTGHGRAATYAYRWEASRGEPFAPPIRGDLLTDGRGHLYISGNGVYEFTGADWSAHTGFVSAARDTTLFADGTAVVTTQADAYVWSGDNINAGWTNIYLNLAAIAIAGAAPNDFYVTNGAVLLHYDGALSTVTPAGFANVADLWWSPSGELFAVGADQLTLVRRGTQWSSIAAPAGTVGCSLMGVGGSAADVVAVGSCSGVGFVWRLAGSAWTEVYRGGGPLVAVTVTSAGDIFAAGPSGGVRSVGDVWQDEPMARGLSISSTTSADVFVAGGPDDVVHWDGTAWSRLAIVGAIGVRVAATPHTVYFGGATDSVLLR